MPKKPIFKKSQTRKRVVKKRYTRRLELRLTETQHSQARQRAQEYGLTLSELFRRAVLQQKLPSQLSPILRQTYWELGKIGTNLNQIAYALNTAVKLGQPMPRELQDISQTLQQLNQTLNQLRQEIIGIE